MIYKRATKQLRAFGIDDVVIVKRLYGAAPEFTDCPRQRSQCFKTWQDAVEAVVQGFRPTRLRQGQL